jgi:2-polyprenyl-6-methoxyphenol hydroxylase-like FAD-dependent oxidoreductase
MDWPLGREEVSLFLSPHGFAMVAPQPDDRYRVVSTAEDASAQPTLELVQALLEQRGPRRAGRIREVFWSSRFRTHHRVAQTLRQGRVLLCGDAAHVHSPAGGQGMNTGIQDAISLARVLAATLEDGHEARIDAWVSERLQVARAVIKLTDRMTRLTTLKTPASKALRNAAIGVVSHVPWARRAIATNLAELNVH